MYPSFADYLRDVVRRLSADPHVSLALFELRLEAARRPGIAATLTAWRQQAFEQDVLFNTDSGLPGGRTEIALFSEVMARGRRAGPRRLPKRPRQFRPL